MTDGPSMSVGAAAAGSARLSLARVAAEAVGRARGVALTAGPEHRWSTGRGAEAVDGVVVIAQEPGVYEIALHLVVDWPPDPLPQLSDRLRREVRAAGERAGQGDRVGRIEVAIEDIRGPGEPIEAAP